MKKNKTTDTDDAMVSMVDKALADGLKKISPEFTGTVTRHFWRLIGQLQMTTTSTADAL